MFCNSILIEWLFFFWTVCSHIIQLCPGSGCTKSIIHTVTKSHEKSWEDLKKHFLGLGKVMDFRKNGRGHGKVMEKSWNFSFWSKYFVLFENWKHSPCHRAKMCPKKAGFSALLSHGKLKLIMEKSWKSHLILLHNFCMNPGRVANFTPADKILIQWIKFARCPIRIKNAPILSAG